MKIDKSTNVTHTPYWSFRKDILYISSFIFRLKKLLKYILNHLILNKFGLAIVQKSSLLRNEQRSYTINHEILSYRNEQIADYLINFGIEHKISFKKNELIKNIYIYESLFRKVNISSLVGGMGFNNGLFLFLLLSKFRPKKVLESGVWRGYSTLLIDKATQNDTKIYSFDINLKNREFFSTKAIYFEQELSNVTEVDFRSIDFAFFDDHVSIYDRLKFCSENNIELVVVDDDVGILQVHSDGWPPIPSASMIYNYDSIPKKFDWINNGNNAYADISNLDVNDICKNYQYVPFPQLTKFTGYSDTSFTSLLIKR